MGQKTHPYGFRLVYNKSWKSRWYADKEYARLLHEDLDLRARLKKRLSHAGVSEIDIDRAADKLRVTIHTSRPGIIIGRSTLPLVNEGEALFHVATFESTKHAEEVVEAFQSPPLPSEPMVDMSVPLD